DGYLSSVANPAMEAVLLTYLGGAGEGLLATLTDPRGNIHSYLYDALGRLVRDESPAASLKILQRTDITDDHYTVTVTTALGLVTSHEVEEKANGDTLRARTEPGGARTETLIRADGSRQVTYPDGTVTNMVEGPDPRFGMQSPILKTYTITTSGGIAASRTATRAVTLSDPTNLLSLATQTDTITTNGQTYTRSYAASTKKVTTTTPAGRQSVLTLDALSRVVSAQNDASFGLAPLLSTYDSQGRLTQVSQGTQSWTYGYDVKGRVNARTDAAGGSIGFAYDAADRATQVTLPGGRTYGLGYDAGGNRTQVAMPGLGAHLLGYDPVNRDSSYAPPANNPYVTTYDADGRANKVTLPGGRTETFTYDGFNRPAGIDYAEAAIAFSYAAGDLTTRIGTLSRTPVAAGPAQQIQFAYGGSLVSGATWTGAAQGQYAYTYDNNFLLKSMALSSGADNVATALTRDGDTLLTGLGPFTVARAGPAGAPSQISDGVLTISQGYDTLGRVASRTHSVGGQPKYAVQFTHDNLGRILSKVETIAGIARILDYGYDTAAHLIEVQRDSVIVERYTYDANRNRLSRRFGNSPAETATYDGQDRLVVQGAASYQFNSDGYLTQRGADTFQYSTTGELLQAVVGGQTVTYAYDGLRRRVSRTVAAGTTQYLYGNPDDDLQVSNTRAPSGVLTTYYYDEGRRLFAMQRGALRYYIATDQLGSPRVLTDTAGAVVRVLEFDAFGNVTADSNPAFELPIGFAGGLADGTTGLLRFGMRDYDPAAGRWTARDPALFDGAQANLYAYVNNNPVNLVDPLGLGSGGVGLCEGICVGLKFSYVDGGISACFEAGFGKGNSVEIDPFGALDENGLSTEVKGSLKAGFAKVEVGADIPVGPCDGFSKTKPKAEACIGPFCANTNNESKVSLDADEVKGGLKNPFKRSGFGWEAKAVGKLCQQAKW
ncbi:MAG: RHS repeat-associated core domain-containing protein, partial [Betaproteobacteria bacterium]